MPDSPDLWAQETQALKNDAAQLAEGPTVARLVNVEELGKYDFRKYEGEFRAVKDLAIQLRDAAFEGIPVGAIRAIRREMSGVLAAVGTILNFQLRGDGDPISLRNKYGDDFVERAGELARVALPAIAFDRQRGSQVETRASEFFTALESATTKSNTLNERLEKLLAAGEKAAAEVAVSGQTGVFAEQASSHRKAATAWLIALVILASATGGLAFSVWAGWWIPLDAPTSTVTTQSLAPPSQRQYSRR